MPFNSNTYHANKYQRRAWEELARARQERDNGDKERAAFFVKMARSSMKLSRTYRDLKKLGFR